VCATKKINFYTVYFKVIIFQILCNYGNKLPQVTIYHKWNNLAFKGVEFFEEYFVGSYEVNKKLQTLVNMME